MENRSFNRRCFNLNKSGITVRKFHNQFEPHLQSSVFYEAGNRYSSPLHWWKMPARSEERAVSVPWWSRTNLHWQIFSIPILYHLWSWSSAHSRDRYVAGDFNSIVLSLSIHCHRLSLSLDGLWELKNGASGSGSTLFYYQILDQSRIFPLSRE